MPDDCLSSCGCCPRVEGCCCCSVETGSIIIGCFFIICGLANLIFRGLDLKNSYHLSSYDFAISVLMLTAGILLLIGIFQGSSLCVKISLILMLVMIGLYIIMAILAIVEMARLKKFAEDVASFLISSVLWTALLFYFFIVVLSYYD